MPHGPGRVSAQGLDHLGPRRVAGGGLFRHRSTQDGAHLDRQPRGAEVHGRRLLGEDLHQDAGHALGLERFRSGEALVEHAAEREEVRPAVHLQAPGLLGRHVVRGAHDQPGGCEVGRRLQLGDAEVHHLHAAPRVDHDVRGLHVPVDHLVRVRVVEGGGDLPQQADRLREVETAPGPEPRLERLALHQLHDDETGGPGRDDVVDGDDVRVAQPRRHLRLAHEAPLDLLELGRLGKGVQTDALDGHVAAEDGVAGAEHLAERAGAEACHRLVAVPGEAAEGHGPRRVRDGQLRQVLALRGHPGIVRRARRRRQRCRGCGSMNGCADPTSRLRPAPGLGRDRLSAGGAGAGPRPGGEGRAAGARGGAGGPLRADRARARLRRPAPPSRPRRPRSLPGLRRRGRVDGSRRHLAGGRVRRVRRGGHVPHGRACPRAPTRRSQRVPRPRAARAAERRAVRVVGGRGARGGPRAPVRPRRRPRGALPRGRGVERGHGPGCGRPGPPAGLDPSRAPPPRRDAGVPAGRRRARPRCASRCA